MAAAVRDTAVFSGLLKRRKWAKGTELSRPPSNSAKVGVFSCGTASKPSSLLPRVQIYTFSREQSGQNGW